MAPGYSMQTGAVALTANATKSLILLNPVTDGGVITELGVSFDGSSAAQAIRVDLYRVTTLGSPAGSTGTVVKRNPNAASATWTGLTALSTEPTSIEILKSWYIAPNGGALVLQHPLGREVEAAAAGGRIGLRYVTPSGVSPNGVAYIEWEE